MHRIVIILLSMMLIVAPVYGQAQGGAQSSPDTLDRVFQFIRDVGAPTALTLLIVFVVYRLGKPGAEAFVENSRARTEAEKAARQALEVSSKAQSDGAAALQGVAAAMVDLANVNKQTMERMAEFEKGTEAAESRRLAVTEMKTHVNEAVAPIAETTGDTLTELRELREQFNTLVTQDQFNGAMTEMQGRLDKIITEMERKQAPCPPEPVAEPPAENVAQPDSAKMDTADEAKE